MRENRIVFFNEVGAPETSAVLSINKANTLTIEVSGEATFNLEVMGTLGVSQENFTSLQGIRINDFSVVGTISTTGIYEYDVSGISKIQLNLASVSGGNISVVGVSRGDY